MPTRHETSTDAKIVRRLLVTRIKTCFMLALETRCKDWNFLLVADGNELLKLDIEFTRGIRDFDILHHINPESPDKLFSGSIFQEWSATITITNPIKNGGE